MNADELDEIVKHLENARYVGAYKAAAMLRQLQAEIEALRRHRAWIEETAVKELTDEEITEVIRKIANNNEYVYSLYEDFEGIEFSGVGIYELCRAILRKAQEK